ncbi:helicase-related protein [Roseicella aerolata]|uniref:Uncharacterized protein n=1 Tax=Roseicella aerolata TaxID=2883479 RepID=A0A9X1IAK4_9PROT|nr:helicase-related protein [Roseicella aerolata]MCB4821250.1 hypothetical protein [Roseicella aerolata]
MDAMNRFWLQVHAQARAIDGRQALLSSLGVAAFAYPHQVDTVRRVLTGTHCRWLIADEVGLGKTVQTLMVLRGLASRRPGGLRVALVVPDDLTLQWEKELLARANVVAIEPSGDGVPPPKLGGLFLNLFRSTRLSLGEVRLEADEYDVLVVDEFPRHPQQVRAVAAAAGRVIPHVLLLSATPALHQEDMRREILGILEPDLSRRAELLNVDVLNLLAEREDVARQMLQSGTLPSFLRAQPIADVRHKLGEVHGLFRRVIRTRRRDVAVGLPRRVYQPICVEGTDGDFGRVETVRRYLDALEDTGVNVRGQRLLQIACRSPQALLRRASTLPRGSSELAKRVADMEVEARNPGDARLDELVDHLTIKFREHPESRVLVVAEDNPTVDYLRDALEPLVGVHVATKRNIGSSSTTELESQIVDLAEEMDPFEAGEARVLVAAEASVVGLNLQLADEIIFYSLPWSPLLADQWIGRIDRLGIRRGAGIQNVWITPIVVSGSIGDKVVQVFKAAGVFEGGQVYDDESWKGVVAAIEAAAYGFGGEWAALVHAAGEAAARAEGWLSLTQFPPFPSAARMAECYDGLRGQRYALPLLSEGGNGFRSWFHEREAAAEYLLRLSQAVHWLDLRKYRDEKSRQRFRTLWYARRPEGEDITVPELDDRGPWHMQALLLKRGEIRSPVVSHITVRDQRERVLHFFDHGDALHDSLVERLTNLPALSSEIEYSVAFPSGHPAEAWKGNRVAIAVGALLPPTFPPLPEGELDSITGGSLSRTEAQALDMVKRRTFEDYLADTRWLEEQHPPRFIALGAVQVGAEFEAVDATPFVCPLWGDGMARCIKTVRLDESGRSFVGSARQFLQKGIMDRLLRSSEELKRRLADTLAVRLYQIEQGALVHDQTAAALVESEARRDQRFDFNRARSRSANLAREAATIANRSRVTRLEAYSKAPRCRASAKVYVLRIS